MRTLRGLYEEYVTALCESRSGKQAVADKSSASCPTATADLELVAVCPSSRLSEAQALAKKYGNTSVMDVLVCPLAVKPVVSVSAH